MRFALGVIALSLLVAACGGSARFDGPPPAQVCGGQVAGLEPAWLKASDGQRLYAVSKGKSDTAVVFAHESGGLGLCGWVPMMQFVAAHGYKVLGFDFRGIYPSPIPAASKPQYDWQRDLQAAIDAAHAKHTILIGASLGGAAVVAYAPDLHGVDGVVSFSGEEALPTAHIDAIGNVARLRVPLLVVASRLDGYLDQAEARQLVRRAGSKDKQVVLYPGTAHGWDIPVQHPQSKQVLLDWLKQRQP